MSWQFDSLPKLQVTAIGPLFAGRRASTISDDILFLPIGLFLLPICLQLFAFLSNQELDCFLSKLQDRRKSVQRESNEGVSFFVFYLLAVRASGSFWSRSSEAGRPAGQ